MKEQNFLFFLLIMNPNFKQVGNAVMDSYCNILV